MDEYYNPVSIIDLIKQEGHLAILMHLSQKGCHVVSSKMMSQLKLVHRKFTVFRLLLVHSCSDYHVTLSCCFCKIVDQKFLITASEHKVEFNKLLTLTSHDHRNFGRPFCNNTAIHTFKRLLNRHLISIKCLQGTNETEYIMSLAARANEIQHRA